MSAPTEPRLAPHPGPPAPPASAAHAGLWGEHCRRYAAPATTGRVRIPIDDVALDRPIAADDELVWAVMPAFDELADDVRDGYRAACVAIDLVTDDGRRMLDLVERETDGTPAHPRTRDDLDAPDQWNERRLALAPLAGARLVAAEFVIDLPAPVGAVGEAIEGWIDGPRIVPAARATPRDATPAERARMTRGTHSSPRRSRGNTQPFAGVPGGGVHVTPATDLGNPHWIYTWNAHGPGALPALAGMLVSRSPSIWIGDRGAIAVRIGLDPHPETGVAPEPFDHDDELAMPHRYAVRTRSGIRIEATATDHAVVVEAMLPATGRIALCAPGAPLEHVALRWGADDALVVTATTTLPSPHEPDPLRGYHAIAVTGVRPLDPADGDGGAGASGGVVVRTADGGGLVRIEIGTSLLSAAHAAAAARRVAGVTVDALAVQARERWDELLGTVDTRPDTAVDTRPDTGRDSTVDDDTRGAIASDLARLFLFPRRHDEDGPAGPEYASPTRRERPDDASGTGRARRPGAMRTDHGFWDTYRTCWPAFALLVPARAGAMLDGMLEHVRDAGWSPRWTAGTPLDAMVGTSLDVVAADLVSAGVPGVDLELAYAAALRNATAASDDPRFGRKGMPASLASGWVDAAVPESVSWTVEGAISDAGAAVLARALARRATGARAAELRADARYLAHRALAYRHLWDPATGFLRPRTADGRWADAPFDPRVWGGAHTETNAWGSRFSAPHDGHGLATLFGGPAALGEALDAAFREPETGRAEFAGSYGSVIHEMPEARDIRRGMWGLSNQPAHHQAWMYAHTDRPWRTDEVIADAVRRLFRGGRIGQGYPGDEDNGEMSAWHLFALLGFAPFAPGSGRLLVTAPQLPRAVLRPIGAPPVEIVTRREHADDRHIQAVRWNGAPWSAPTIGIDELHEGGRWEVDLGPTPSAWRDPLPERPHFAPDGVATVALRDAVRAVGRTGRARREWRLAAGDALRLRLDSAPAGADAPLLVIGLADAGTHAFRIVDASGRTLAAVRDATWVWPSQAKAFEVALPAGIDEVRIVWESPEARLRLVQLLVADEPRRRR